VGLWFMTPERFTSTDEPAGVVSMIVVGLAGLSISVFLSGVLMRK
jgi:hypothetical protein